jgi:D-3-phosphoglycerate dehydrogenase
MQETTDPKEADIILCGSSRTKIHKSMKSKIVVCNMTNVNHIDHAGHIVHLDDPDELKDVCSTAEHTLMLILMLLKHYTPTDENRRPMFPGATLNGKTVGVIGYGRIGRKVTKMCLDLGANVFVHDKKMNDNLEHCLDCDIITLHTSVKKGQKPVLGPKELSSIQPGTFIVNTSRGEAIDERYLLSIIETLGGYAADVFSSDDMYRRIKAYASLYNIFCTPHTAGYTIEDLRATSEICYKKLMNYIGGNNGSGNEKRKTSIKANKARKKARHSGVHK